MARAARAERRVAEWPILVLLGVVFALSGCHASFQPTHFANPEALYKASLVEYQRKHWDNAQQGFEQLSNELSARDPLLPSVLFYLALTHERRGENLLAAQAYLRMSDGFPDDSLAPAAVLGAGRAYQKMWRKTTLDPEEGQQAATTYRMLLATYPTSKEADVAKAGIDTLENMFAKKDYDTGMHYVRRKAIDPAIIYLKDVVKNYPKTATARLAWLRLHQLYEQIRWKDDAQETCASMWMAYPGDADVAAACGKQPADTSAAARPRAKADTAEVIPGELARPGP
jgi:outer membrane assembly lipoprotein YfiO